MEDLGPPPSPQDLGYPTDDIPGHRDDNFDYANNEQGGNESNGDDHPPPGHPLDGDDDANHVDVDDPAVQQAVHAAMDAASPAPAPVSLSTSLPTFSELDGGHDHDHHVVMSLPEADDSHLHASSDAFLDDDDPYAQQYTSASVPVPPMMDWHHEAPPPSDQSSQGPAPNPIRNAMGLHSPIVSADAEHRQPSTEPAVSSSAAAAPPMPPAHPHANAPPPPPSSEHNMYTSYAIAPGPPPHHHHPHPASHYDPHVPPHSMYAHYPPHAYVMPPSQAPPQVPRIPSYAAAAATPKSAPQTNHNSNFWLQEEEERFLLGLRLYGWGQWKRIQTVVQTRSNKQIKSHAQKREKVNPEIKFKYAKGKSRRGRISSKVLASEYSSGPEQEGVAAAAATSLNDPRLPPMEELWKDVYGTNNGVGPNSRLRRYRSNALHQKWLEEVAEKTTDGEAQVAPPLATEKKTKSPTMASSSSEPLSQDKAAAAKKKLTPEGQYIHDHKVLERHAMTAPRHPSPGPPLPYYNAPPPPHGHAYPPPPPNYAMPPPGVSPPRMAYPPPQGYPHAGMGHPPPAHLPVLHHGNAPASTTARAPPAQGVASHEEPLRPGMRVYARSKNAPHWYPGIIYSAKVDPNKTIDPHQAAVPLVYHVQFDGGGMREDPEVPEEYILGKARYERALDDLEAYYDLSSSTMGPRGTSSLEGGMPVYAQWMERSNPTSHARWLPGTIDSVRREETAHGPVDTYRILFDNAAEKTDVSSECVLERNEYHQLVQRKHAYPPAEGASLRTPIGEIYDLFSRGDANSSGSGQGMDLLFTASQMAAPMDTLKKRDAASMTKEEGGAVEESGEVEESGDAASKRIKTDSEEHLTTSQEENFTL